MTLRIGWPTPLGATPYNDGVNFALVAPNATAVELCLFDSTGTHEQQRLQLPACTDGVWHGRLPQGQAGLVYGYRVHGPWAPHDGHRYNPAKLVLDPYAREIVGSYDGSDIFWGHDPANPEQPDPRDNGAVALKARVALPLAPAAPSRPRVEAGQRVIYELHVRGQTRLHPEVPTELQGTYAGLAEPAVLDHLQRLGVTTLSLLPVQHRADEQRLLNMGLGNYWGYSTIGWFAPEARYWSGRAGTTPASEFRAMADAIHARGMELVIDVVYNHSAETDELGPTLQMRGIDNALYYHLRRDDRALYENWTGCGNCLDFSQPRVVQLCMDSLRHWVIQLGVDGFRFDLATVLARGADGEFDPRAPFLAAARQDPVLADALWIAEPWDIGMGGYRVGEFPPGWLEWNDRYRDTLRTFWLRGGVSRGEFAQRFTASSDRFNHDGRAPTASVNFIVAHDGFTLRDLVSYNERHNEANGEQGRDGSSQNHSNNCGVEGETDDAAVLAQRARLQRALLASLLLSQGTPMMLAGSELGQTQQGNNNAYCQDGPLTWLDWQQDDGGLTDFVARVLALRREAEPLRHAGWWPGTPVDGEPALRWRTPEGSDLTPGDWQRPDTPALAILFETPAPAPQWLVLFNAGTQAIDFALPPGNWTLQLASDNPQDTPRLLAAGANLPPSSLWVART
ncbi:glycogen debranching protein GlgX [Variovorax sp. dw_954]|uniref:glycogen debranching protein GlgX n=1 Tax=Variovorax sp. dw_954 TaxID=2720078 RepID=UPI001BD5B6FF|nr:glycogen debranching protein GlgX [Variovorax sp. dw_954]